MAAAPGPRRLVAGVEGGGTTWVCALAPLDDPAKILERATFDTTGEPAATLSAVAAWLEARRGRFGAVGIATFGPVDPRRGSPTFGFITETPKPGWRNTDVVGRLAGSLDADVVVAFDTDVNAPAVAEYRATIRDDAEGSTAVTSLAYVTVGTGVGVGLCVNGAPVHGFLHPEGGHVAAPLHAGDAAYDASGLTALACDGWHEIEAMVATRALARRAGCDAKDLALLPDDHPVWDAAAHYLASLVATLVLVVSPQRVVLSGGVMQRASLFPEIRRKVVAYLNGYIPNLDAAACEEVVVPSKWRNDAGIVGALTLARDALLEREALENTPAVSSSSTTWCRRLLGTLTSRRTSATTTTTPTRTSSELPAGDVATLVLVASGYALLAGIVIGRYWTLARTRVR
mmetsp:Transcript_14424/g.57473  ORF Transcript_14424/g.57473 Transcript_14424/m.57473 type:complete len:401 (+) Transcript_14424:86-1288(+)